MKAHVRKFHILLLYFIYIFVKKNEKEHFGVTWKKGKEKNLAHFNFI